jgi:hypothetical protein
MKEKPKEKFTTIYVPASLHKQLTMETLEISIKTGKKMCIWEYIKHIRENQKT